METERTEHGIIRVCEECLGEHGAHFPGCRVDADARFAREQRIRVANARALAPSLGWPELVDEQIEGR